MAFDSDLEIDCFEGDDIVEELTDIWDMDALEDTPFSMSSGLEHAQDDEAFDSDGMDDIESDVEDEVNNDKREMAISALENFTIDFMQQLLDSLPDSDDLREKREKKKNVVLRLADRRRESRPDGTLEMRRITYPRNSKFASAKPIAQVLRVVDLVHEALVNNVPTTKRDIYYKDVTLFGSQAVVDKLVDDISATIGVGRADLRVRASSKGLFCGSSISMHLHSGELVTGNTYEGTLIPPSEDINRFEVAESLSWVLVIEKEAVFQTLCHAGLTEHPDLPGNGVLITGKGYPDVATRQLVCTLNDNLPKTIPIIALVDGDPYGIDIMSVYKFGSACMMHERETLAAERIKWAGIELRDIIGLGVSMEELIPITQHDEKKALTMLRRDYLPRRWKKELQKMLHARRKAEIEVLSHPVQKPRRPSVSPSLNSHADINDGSTEIPVRVEREYALVSYLLTKISKAVHSHQEKHV